MSAHTASTNTIERKQNILVRNCFISELEIDELCLFEVSEQCDNSNQNDVQNPTYGLITNKVAGR